MLDLATKCLAEALATFLLIRVCWWGPVIGAMLSELLCHHVILGGRGA